MPKARNLPTKAILIVLLLIPLFVIGQTKGGKKLNFDKVIMYDYEGQKGNGLFILEHGKLARSVTKQRVLTNAEANSFTDKLRQKASYGGIMAECFDPHLGFVLYAKDSIVAHITVCLDCNRISMSLRIPGLEQERTVTTDEIYYTKTGMSKSFRKFLNGLILKYGFSHQIKPGSIADQ